MSTSSSDSSIELKPGERKKRVYDWQLDDVSTSFSDSSIELKPGYPKKRVIIPKIKLAKVPSGCDSSNMTRNEDVIIIDNTDDESVKDSTNVNKTIDKSHLFKFPFSYEIGEEMYTISYNDEEDNNLTLGMREARGQVCNFIDGIAVWEDANKNNNDKYSRSETQGNKCYETIIDEDKIRLLSTGTAGYFNDNIINFWMLW